MKVDNPRFDETGEVACSECPLNELGTPACHAWLKNHRTKGEYEAGDCPTAETYQEAAALAGRVLDAP